MSEAVTRRCAVCGHEPTEVRPGKYQCDFCEESSDLLRRINESHSRLVDAARRRSERCLILSKGEHCTCELCDIDFLANKARQAVASRPVTYNKSNQPAK